MKNLIQIINRVAVATETTVLLIDGKNEVFGRLGVIEYLTSDVNLVDRSYRVNSTLEKDTLIIYVD